MDKEVLQEIITRHRKLLKNLAKAVRYADEEYINSVDDLIEAVNTALTEIEETLK